jgi:hypothetical protein
MLSADIQEHHARVITQSNTQGILVSWEWNGSIWNVRVERLPVKSTMAGEYQLLWAGEIAP